MSSEVNGSPEAQTIPDFSRSGSTLRLSVKLEMRSSQSKRSEFSASSRVHWATGRHVYGLPRMSDLSFRAAIGSAPRWRSSPVTFLSCVVRNVPGK